MHPMTPPSAHAPKTPITTLAAVALLIICSSFNYLFVGALPVWVVPAAVILGLALLSPLGRARLAALCRSARWPLAAWTAFLLATLALDLLAGLRGRSFMSGFMLNMFALLVFVAAAYASAVISRRVILLTVATIALAQGLVCIAQMFGVGWAWDLPTAVSAAVGRPPDPELAEALQKFVDVRRVRGSHLMVHTFNVMQAALVAYLFAVLVLERRRSAGLSSADNLLVLVAMTVGAVGVALTFSRSGLVGLALVLVLVLVTNPRPRVVLLAAIGIGAAAALAVWVGFTEADMFDRLFLFSGAYRTNSARLEHIEYTFSVLTQHPWLGLSTPGAAAYDRATPIHSVLMRQLADYGLVGGVLYLGTILSLVGLYARDLRTDTRPSALAALSVLLVVVADAWTHSSGLLRKDVFQACMLGLAAGPLLAPRMAAILSERRLRSRSPAMGAVLG